MISDVEIFEQEENVIVIDVTSDKEDDITISLTRSDENEDYYVDAYLSCIEDDKNDFDLDSFRKELIQWLDKLGIKYTIYNNNMFIDEENVNKLLESI